MKRLRCLLLDANVVIYLFELGIWDQIVEHCEIFLSRTVLEQEVRYYDKDRPIDLSDYVASGKISVVEVDVNDLDSFLRQFNPVYLERLDPGEAESLAYLCKTSETYILCSSDAIVFQVLAYLSRTDQGISLEEILNQIGFSRAVKYQFSKGFRERWTKRGQQDMIAGLGDR